MTAIATGGMGRRSERLSFVQKLVGGAVLVAAADWLFFFQWPGSIAGGYAAALLAMLLLLRPAMRRGAALVALAVAAFHALALAYDPSPLAAALCWTAASLATLIAGSGFDDGWRWTKRLLLHWLTLPFGPVEDGWRIRAARHRVGAFGISRNLPMLWLPLIGTILFLALFAAANPLIETAFARVDLLAVLGAVSLTRLAFWILAAMLAWSLIRPRRLQLAPRRQAGEPRVLLGVSLGSVTLSLLAFNAIFGLQNGLDLAFLWSGAPLPAGMTLAEYAHRGAYPLIATALLAGLFVLVTLRPGSPLAESATLRRLVYLWIGQNVLLVASTVLRTLDYVDAYSLTRLRLAALIWMILVAVGLVLICLRIARRRSGAWLINANLAAATIVLTACSFVDLGAMAAHWNVGHAREVGGPGAALDLCYLQQLGGSALLPLVELESRPLPPALRDRVAWTRNLAMDAMETEQDRWRSWSARDAGRLAAARGRIAERGLPRFHASPRYCGGNALTGPEGQ